MSRCLSVVALSLLAVLPTLALAYQAEPPRAPLQVLRVDRYADDANAGSLRWAITTANADPGRYRIEIDAVGVAPYVIRPASPLPEVKGPVQIIGTSWARDGQYIAIDGSAYVTGSGTDACPGAEPGQSGTNVRTTTLPGLVLRDTQGVELAGLEIRNFCIGVLVNRSSQNEIHDNRIVANKGGAGIMLTGDDGKGQSTATTTVHNRIVRNVFLDNGDGLELTRGAAWNLVADNLFQSTAANPEPSQGIEILWGNDNTVVHNRFVDYSDGLQINWGNRNYIAANTFTGNSLGLSITGSGNVVDGNTITGNGIGIGVRPQPVSAPNRFTANRIYGNGLPIERCEAGGACVKGQPRGGHRVRRAGAGTCQLRRFTRSRRRQRSRPARAHLHGCRPGRLPALAEPGTGRADVGRRARRGRAAPVERSFPRRARHPLPGGSVRQPRRRRQRGRMDAGQRGSAYRRAGAGPLHLPACCSRGCCRGRQRDRHGHLGAGRHLPPERAAVAALIPSTRLRS